MLSPRVCSGPDTSLTSRAAASATPCAGSRRRTYDIATDARPEQVQALFPRTLAIGAHFGVIAVREGGWQFEVASFPGGRCVYIDGRRPVDVNFTTPQGDAERRDFTINGMFQDPVAERGDRLRRADRQTLRRGKLRAIGGRRRAFPGRPSAAIARGALRGGVRLRSRSAHLGLPCARTPGEIGAVSAERIRDELVKDLPWHRHGCAGSILLDASGLLKVILPELDACKGCDQPPQFHPEGDVFVHTRLMLSLLPAEVSAPLIFSVLLHDIGKPPTAKVDPDGRIRFNGHEHVGAEMTLKVMERLRFSRAEIDRDR